MPSFAADLIAQTRAPSSRADLTRRSVSGAPPADGFAQLVKDASAPEPVREPIRGSNDRARLPHRTDRDRPPQETASRDSADAPPRAVRNGAKDGGAGRSGRGRRPSRVR